MSSPGVISAAPDEVAQGVEGGATPPGTGGARLPEAVTVLEVRWLGRNLWMAHMYIPGLGRRRIYTTDAYATPAALAITGAALRALYTT